jgi:hypothetical protein
MVDSTVLAAAPGGPRAIVAPLGAGVPADPRQGTAAAREMHVFAGTSQHPYLIGERAWLSMSPDEQTSARARWEALSPDQRRRLKRDIRMRDSLRFMAPPPRSPELP